MKSTLKNLLSAVHNRGRKLAIIAFIGWLCAPCGWAHEIVLEWNRYWGVPRLNPCYMSLLKVDDRIYIGGTQSIGNGGDVLLLGEINDQMDGFVREVTYGDSLHSFTHVQLHYFNNQIVTECRIHGEDGNDDNLRMIFHYLDLNGDSLDGFAYPLLPRGGPWSRDSFIDEEGNLILFIVSADDGAYNPFRFWRINREHELEIDRIYDGETDFGNQGYDYGKFNGLRSAIMLRDGTYIITGSFTFRQIVDHMYNPGRADCIMRLNSYGDLLWLNINPDSVFIRDHYAYNCQGTLEAALEHSSGAIYATGITDLYSPPYHAVTLYKYDQDGSMHWRRLYNDNYGITQTYFYRIIELRPDILGLFGYVDYCRGDEREPGLFVAMVDTSGEMLTNTVIHGERINDISDDFKDVLQIDSNHVLALTKSFHRVLCIRFDFDDEIVDDDDVSPGPYSFIFNSAYPNPFNSSVNIGYALNEDMDVDLEVFDQSGRLVTMLHQGREKAGYHNVTWDAANAPSGIYLCRLKSGVKECTVKLTLVK